MDERTGNYVGVQLLQNKQREELKSKWRSWFERKISSETDREEKSKWKQLLATNRFSYPKADYPGSPNKADEQNRFVSNGFTSHSVSDISTFESIPDISATDSFPDIIHVEPTSVPDIVPSAICAQEFSAVENPERHKNENLDIHVTNNIVDKMDVKCRGDITDPDFFTMPNHLKGKKDESLSHAVSENKISTEPKYETYCSETAQIISKLRTVSTDSNQTVYQQDWDNMSDFPNVGSLIASTINDFNDSISKISDNTVQNVDDDSRLPVSGAGPYYCPYPPKVPRNNPYQPEFVEVGNEVRTDYPVFDDTPSHYNFQNSPETESRRSRANSIGNFSRTNSTGNFSRVNSVGNFSRANSIGNFSRKSLNNSNHRKPSLRSTNPTSNYGEKANISEHQYDDFPAVSKSKWTDLLTMDSWKIGARLLRGSAYNSARSSISPLSECSTEGQCKINGTVNSIDRNFLKVNLIFTLGIAFTKYVYLI